MRFFVKVSKALSASFSLGCDNVETKPIKFEISTDGGATWEDVGVITGAVKWEVTST